MQNHQFNRAAFIEAIFASAPVIDFNVRALELFRYQAQNNHLYQEFIQLWHSQPDTVTQFHEIPFLPIRFFKSRTVKTGIWDEKVAVCFTSSGTTGDSTSRHYVNDISLYERSFLASFRLFYGDPEDWVILGLLPSYLEREGSSLIYMTEKLIKLSGRKESGFFLNNTEELFRLIKSLEERAQPTILLGVSFALLDFCEKYTLPLKHTLIMETGGMKGRKKEMTRAELHDIYKKSLGVSSIHSEYGMTELLSQAYSKGDGRYFSPPWMKVVITSLTDPKQICEMSQTGRINVIDLANIDSCAFLSTDDLGKLNADGSFEILGRMDNSDIRGCSLLLS